MQFTDEYFLRIKIWYKISQKENILLTEKYGILLDNIIFHFCCLYNIILK